MTKTGSEGGQDAAQLQTARLHQTPPGAGCSTTNDKGEEGGVLVQWCICLDMVGLASLPCSTDSRRDHKRFRTTSSCSLRVGKKIQGTARTATDWGEHSTHSLAWLRPFGGMFLRSHAQAESTLLLHLPSRDSRSLGSSSMNDSPLLGPLPAMQFVQILSDPF